MGLWLRGRLAPDANTRRIAADVRTVVDTARLKPGANAFKIILQTVAG